MREFFASVALVLGVTLLGCGGNSDTVVIPSDKLTAEQEAQLKIEDQNVEDEESQGKLKKAVKKK